jgi:hypothetical protein
LEEILFQVDVSAENSEKIVKEKASQKIIKQSNY